MKTKCSDWSINSRLALVAVVAGFIAIFMRDPLKARIVSFNENELATQIQDKSSSVMAEDLAELLIQKKTDFTLVDLQSEARYREYNIPGSINMSLKELIDSKTDRSEKIILYSDDNTQSAQAWVVLKAMKYKAVYLLSGGLTEWKNQILFPTLSNNPTPEEKAKFDKISEISRYFGGSPRLAASDSTGVKPQAEMPKMVPPAPVAASKAGGSKPKREGC